MQHFMKPSSSLPSPSSNHNTNGTKESMQGPLADKPNTPRPAIHNKVLQLPPSPPSSVSSATGSKLGHPSSGLDSPIISTPPSHDVPPTFTHHTSATPPKVSAQAAASAAPSSSVKTPFDFVSPFDLLSTPHDHFTPQPAPAQVHPASSLSTKQQLTDSDGAVNTAIVSLYQKLSAFAASKALPADTNFSAIVANLAPLLTASQSQPQASAQPEASQATSPTPPTSRKLSSPSDMLEASDKQFHASRHAAMLEQDQAFDDPTFSGLSVLLPSRSSSAPIIVTLDLAAKQPGGLLSLRHAKIETVGIALLPSPLRFPSSISTAGLLPACRVANLTHNAVCYIMSKGIRIVDASTGVRQLLRAPNKAAIRSIAAFQPTESDSLFLLAALVERSKDDSSDSVVFWKLSPSFVLHSDETSEPTLLGCITADAPDSPFDHCITSIAWHPHQPKLAISTSDNNVIVFDVAGRFLNHIDATSSSSDVRSCPLSAMDPYTNRVANNGPLAAFAFSPDGSMLATVSAPLQAGSSCTLRFKSIDGSTSATGDLAFSIELPRQEPLVISHLSFINGISNKSKSKSRDSDALAIRAVLIGFQNNKLLGLYDLSSGSFKHLWQFQAPPQASAADKDHFNLVLFDSQASTLLVCNSFRSSIFAISLDFQPLPAGLEQRLLPWSVQLSYPIKEYALQEPCTSATISLGSMETNKASRLFVASTERISIVKLPKPQDLAPKPEATAATEAALAALESSLEASAVEPQAAPSKSNKKKNKKKKKASAAKLATGETAADKPQDSEEPLSEHGKPAASIIAVKPASASTSESQRSQSEALVSTPKQTPPAATSSIASNVQPTPIPTHVQSTNGVTLAADTLTDALCKTITLAVHDAVSAEVTLDLQNSVELALADEMERLMSSTELKDELTRYITQCILPAVQRTAMEVMGRVLAPDFEDVMMQVVDRVERAIVSEMTNVRKSLIAEQTASFNETEKVVKTIQTQVGNVLEQLAHMRAQPANKTPAAADNDASRIIVQANPTAGIITADELSEVQDNPSGLSRSVNETASAQIAHNAKAMSETRKDTDRASAQLPTKCQLPERVAVIGAGPVGCLAALAFAQRGCKVDIFESRPDPRTHEAITRASQRSINLALSTRGITGLRSVSLAGLGVGTNAPNGMDLADLVLQNSVPMRARMIHVVTRQASANQAAEVKEISQLYSTKGESINSVDRGRLNNILLEHALMHRNVEVHFEHKLQSVDFDHDIKSAAKRAGTPPPAIDASANKWLRGANVTGGDSCADEPSGCGGRKQATTKSQGSEYVAPAGTSAVDRVRLDFDVHSTNQHIRKTSNTHYASFVVGCDGAHSSIRSAMGSLIRMHYTHNYIDTGYIELSIPPRTSLGSGSRIRGSGGVDGKRGGHDAFHLDANHLHIWPRHSFMLIALPNLDGSFTCTLFAPFKMFASELSTKEGIVAVFQQHFPDALALIDEEKLVKCLTTRRASALGSVQCDPYHYKDRAVLIGDAAHAMLPFYGQGLNCGFEDVRVMFDIIDQHESLQVALDLYTKERHPDLVAILQLAEQNYREMAHSVVSWPYLLRKKLDGLLMSILPSSMWSSLYAMTTFSNLPYSRVVKTEKRQQAIIGHALVTTAVAFVSAAAVGVYTTRALWQPVTVRCIARLHNS